MVVRKKVVREPEHLGSPERRQLYFHPESDSYVECWSEQEGERYLSEGCLEVGGIRKHEANYYDQQKAKVEKVIDDIRRMFNEKLEDEKRLRLMGAERHRRIK